MESVTKEEVANYMERHKEKILEWMVHPGFGQFTSSPANCLNSIVYGIRHGFENKED